MNHLVADPHLEHCPDFASPIFHASCLALLSPTVDDAQAAIMLQTIWVATNTAQKVQWQQQLDNDALEATEQRRLLAEADA
jgi:hypothetical protein